MMITISYYPKALGLQFTGGVGHWLHSRLLVSGNIGAPTSTQRSYGMQNSYCVLRWDGPTDDCTVIIVSLPVLHMHVRTGIA